MGVINDMTIMYVCMYGGLRSNAVCTLEWILVYFYFGSNQNNQKDLSAFYLIPHFVSHYSFGSFVMNIREMRNHNK